MSLTRHHTDWLNLLEVSGPFLSVSVLTDAFPQELDAHDPHAYSQLKLAYDEWLEGQSQLEVHHAWIDFVLSETLELGDVLQRGQDIPSALEAKVDLHGETLRPDAIVARADSKVTKPELLICQYPSQQKLGGSLAGKRWSASPATRMMELLHRTNSSLGLVTNGDEWMVVHAKSGEVTGFGSWYSELLTEEKVALRSFRSLLGLHRFFGVSESETFQGLLERSREDQKEVTDQLGRQVRHAVETLISALDWVDRDQNRQLLADYDETKLYEAALTVMMRLVFLLCAEERGLLLLGKNDLYDQHYAVSPLRDQLREEADQYGEEILESRYDAWSRLLSTFRAVHAGVAHEELHLPAYGGSLFDPDRFPFLEGRDADTNWKDEPASPLPINNRTVLELLESLQLLEVRVGNSRTREAQRLSFRALDIEQIGHVYEGLLDHTAVRADSPVLGLQGAKDLEPEVPLYALEDAKSKGGDKLLSYLKDTTKRSPKTLEKELGLYETIESPKLPLVCDNDPELVKRVRPYIGLVRQSSRGMPTVFTKGSVYVTQGSDRRSTGTHYTPRSLTEEIVQHALDPLVYEGMQDGVEPSLKTLKTAKEILELKVCDLAMGSGAFLVQACRFLSEKVVEAWGRDKQDDDDSSEHREELLAEARRLVVEKCLYGVDKNPLAVEMAKLSLWLITLDAKKPFSFLDHALRCGDSLVGITDRNQIRCFHPDPSLKSLPVIGDALLAKLNEAEDIRRELQEFTVNEPRDGERKREMLAKSECLIGTLRTVGDLLLGISLAAGGKPREAGLSAAMPLVLEALEGTSERATYRAQELLRHSSPDNECRPFHWAMEFPEVFSSSSGGFHSIVGNPPFQGGKKISAALGEDYRKFVVTHIGNGAKGSADLCAFFFLQALNLLSSQGTSGLLGTDTVAQAGTRKVGLKQMLAQGAHIYRAASSRLWPGTANLMVVLVWFSKEHWDSKPILDNREVNGITSHLEAGTTDLEPRTLSCNVGQAFMGTLVHGMGFLLTQEEADTMKEREPKSSIVLFPYLTGKDVNSDPYQRPSRWVINFLDWPKERAQEYGVCFEHLVENVKPFRDEVVARGKQIHEYDFWKFWDKRLESYEKIASLKQVIVTSLVTHHWCPVFCPSGFVYSHKCGIFCESSFGFYAVLQSTLHEVWARRYSSTLGQTLNYTISACFETFPFPENYAFLSQIGEDYHTLRFNIMAEAGQGLTDIYNRFHDPQEDSEEILSLRMLHRKMDEKVAAAYGWDDLHLGHEFYETKYGFRYSIKESAREVVLDRLLILNGKRSASTPPEKVEKHTGTKRRLDSDGQGKLF